MNGIVGSDPQLKEPPALVYAIYVRGGPCLAAGAATLFLMPMVRFTAAMGPTTQRGESSPHGCIDARPCI